MRYDSGKDVNSSLRDKAIVIVDKIDRERNRGKRLKAGLG